MAASNALNGEPRAFEWTIFSDGFHCILAASGCEAAARRKERRNALPVELYGQNEQCGEQMFHNYCLLMVKIGYNFRKIAECIFEFFFYESIVANIVVHIDDGNIQR